MLELSLHPTVLDLTANPKQVRAYQMSDYRCIWM